MSRGGELVRRPSQEVATLASREIEVREKSSEELVHIQHELGKGAVSKEVVPYQPRAEIAVIDPATPGKELVPYQPVTTPEVLPDGSGGLLQIEGKKEWPTTPKQPELMTVGHIDLSHNAERKAYDIADRRIEDMKEENSKRFLLSPKRIARNIWGYNAAHRKILNQARGDIIRAQDVNVIDEEFDAEARQRYSAAIFEQFFDGGDDAIDTSANEDREFFGDDHEATIAAKALYAEFARAGTEDSPAMTDDEFNERIIEIRGLMNENAATTATGEVMQDNYLEAARAMRGRIEHGEAVEDILEGFELMRGEARSDARTEVHKTRTDELLDRYERSRVGEIIPSNVLAVGVAAAAFAATRGAGALAKVAAFGGGSAVIGIIAGKRESVDINKQRARRERETFRGKEFVDSTKREQELSEFEHERVSADKLIENLRGFREKLETDGFDEATIKASLDELANIQVLKDLSASEGIDLFDHGKSGDPTKHLQDRMELARSQAELKELLREAVDAGDTTVLETLGINPDDLSDEYDSYDAVDSALDNRSSLFHEVKLRDISAKDEAFQKYRRKESFKKGAKAAAFSLVAGVAMQEALSMVSSNKAGLIERAWGGNNSEAAGNTVLNGFDNGSDTTVTHLQENLSAERIAELKSNGSEVIANTTTTYETVTSSVSVSEYGAAHPGELRHFSEVNLFDNSTEVFDKNELGGQLAREPGGGVRIWDTMAADGSTRGEAAIDMMKTENNVFTMALKEPDGSYSHKVFEYGQSIDQPYANLLYEKEDGTWGFKGDGYVAWGQSSGESLDVAASIAGDGGPNTLTTTSEVPTVHYDYEIRTTTETDRPLDVPPAIWSASRSRLGNARRPEAVPAASVSTEISPQPQASQPENPPAQPAIPPLELEARPQPSQPELEARPRQSEQPPAPSREIEPRNGQDTSTPEEPQLFAGNPEEQPTVSEPVSEQVPESAPEVEQVDSSSPEETTERVQGVNKRLDRIMEFYGRDAERAGVTAEILEQARAIYERVIRERGADITNKSLGRRAAAEVHPDRVGEGSAELAKAINWLNERLNN